MSSVTTMHCKMLLAEYTRIKTLVQSLASKLSIARAATQTYVDAINNNDLDNIANDMLKNYYAPNELTELTDSLEQALRECPAIQLVIPPSTVSKIASGIAPETALPKSLIKDFNTQVKSNLIDDVQSKLGQTKSDAMEKLKEYEDDLNNTGLIDKLEELRQMEECLESICGLISAGEKIYNSTLTDLRLTESYGLNYTQIASDASQDVNKLTLAHARYKNRIEEI